MGAVVEGVMVHEPRHAADQLEALLSGSDMGRLRRHVERSDARCNRGGGGDKAHGGDVVHKSEGFIVRDITTGPDGARYTVRMQCWPDTVDPRDTKGGG